MPQTDSATAIQAQTRAVLQFREWANDPRALVLDTETTSLEGPVWEFAAVRIWRLTPVLAWTASASFAEWSERALELHRDRLEEIAGYSSPALFEVATRALLMRLRPLSYGADFDGPALNRTFARPLTPIPPFECIMRAYAPLAGKWSALYQDWEYVSLTEALERERVDVRGLPEHTGYGDACRAALLVQAVAQRLTAAELEAHEVAEAQAQVGGVPVGWDVLDTSTGERDG